MRGVRAKEHLCRSDGPIRFDCCDLYVSHIPSVILVRDADGGATDNLRYAADYCIFNDSKIATTPCITTSACEPFLDSLTYHNNIAPSGATDYGYCNQWDDSDILRCQNCVAALEEEEYLVNCTPLQSPI